MKITFCVSIDFCARTREKQRERRERDENLMQNPRHEPPEDFMYNIELGLVSTLHNTVTAQFFFFYMLI